MQLPKEVDVVLEDGIKTTLPVKWNEADYDKTKEGETTINGTLEEIAGVKLADDKKNTTVVVKLQKDTEVPVITSQPKSQTVQVGENAVFTVEAEINDGGNLTYQWQVNSGTDWQNIEGATNPTYTKEKGIVRRKRNKIQMSYCKYKRRNGSKTGIYRRGGIDSSRSTCSS